MVSFKLAERSLGVISTILLARLLVPADFGLVAMATSIIALIELASAFSFEIALIQRPHPTRADYDTAWTLNVALGVFCGLAMVALAYPAAVFYSEPRLTLVMVVLAVSSVILNLENIGVVDFRRNLNFSREFNFLLWRKLSAFIVTVGLAIYLRSYWALVIGTLVSRVVGVAMSYWMSSYRPRFSLAARGDLFSFSGWLFVNNLLGFAINRLSHFVIGRLHGPSLLGLYTVGAEIANLPATELVAPVNRAVFPGYSRMTGEMDQLRRGFIEVVAVVAAIALPASVGVAALADPLVRALLGNKWVDAVVFVQILAFNGTILAITANNYSIYLALGRVRLLPLLAAIKLVILIGLLYAFAVPFGVKGVAFAELGATIFSACISFIFLFAQLKLSKREYFAQLWRSVLAAAAMGVTVNWAIGMVGSEGEVLTAIGQLALGIPLGVVVYVIALLALWLAAGKPTGAESYILAAVEKLLLKRRAVRDTG